MRDKDRAGQRGELDAVKLEAHGGGDSRMSNTAVPGGLGLQFAPEARQVRRLLRLAGAASLATLDRSTGTPFVSLIQITALPDARPCFLISSLAEHTKNLEEDPRASILVDQRVATGAMTAERATLLGRAHRLQAADDVCARQRFLQRHPDAETYAGFADFSFWCLDLDRAHLVAGFGRIREVAGAALTLADMSAAVAAGEGECISQLQNEFAHQLDLHRARLAGWDVEGLVMVTGEAAMRLDFHAPQVTRTGAHEAARAALQQYFADACES